MTNTVIERLRVRAINLAEILHEPTSRNYDQRGVSKFYSFSMPHPLDQRLTIPRLRLGSINDLALCTDTVAHSGNFGVLYRGLHEYVRMKMGRRKIPAYVFDNHNHALFGWCEALDERKIVKGATLIHFDMHGDEGYPEKPMENTTDLSRVRDYVSRLKIDNFIAPAHEQGLVRQFIWVDPFLPSNLEYEVETPKGRLSYRQIGMDNTLLDDILKDQVDPQKLIVDVDMDYYNSFFTHWSNLLLERRVRDISQTLFADMAKMRQVAKKAGVITIATSPEFIDQTAAITLVRSFAF